MYRRNRPSNRIIGSVLMLRFSARKGDGGAMLWAGRERRLIPDQTNPPHTDNTIFCDLRVLIFAFSISLSFTFVVMCTQNGCAPVDRQYCVLISLLLPRALSFMWNCFLSMSHVATRSMLAQCFGKFKQRVHRASAVAKVPFTKMRTYPNTIRCDGLKFRHT